jgi:hypothetical protein
LKKIEEYLKDAAECREMARIAFADHRQRLEQMARTLEGFAETRRQQINQQTD